MSRLSDAIKNNIVKPELDRLNTSTIATILSYNASKNTARISYTNSIGNVNIEVDNILISLGPGGIVGQSPREGDQVIISFVDGSSTPIIIQFIDEYYNNGYKKRTMHNRSGAFLPDSLNAR